MRKVISITYLSLDGVMQGPGGVDEDTRDGFTLGGWSMPYWDQMMNGALEKLMQPPFDLLLGRETYDIFVRYWPQNLDNPIGAKFDRATKYVMTRGGATLRWARSQPLQGDASETVRALKSGEGPDLHIWGSGEALQSLIALGLVDEMMIWTFPLILGQGKRLFQPGLPATKLALTESLHSTTGVVINTYRQVGPL